MEKNIKEEKESENKQINDIKEEKCIETLTSKEEKETLDSSSKDSVDHCTHTGAQGIHTEERGTHQAHVMIGKAGYGSKILNA